MPQGSAQVLQFEGALVDSWVTKLYDHSLPIRRKSRRKFKERLGDMKRLQPLKQLGRDGHLVYMLASICLQCGSVTFPPRSSRSRCSHASLKSVSPPPVLRTSFRRLARNACQHVFPLLQRAPAARTRSKPV
eukprot:347521-Chlamydomonas_euryale.AAC.1